MNQFHQQENLKQTIDPIVIICTWYIVWQWRAGRGAMATPAKDFRRRKTCKKGRQTHEMKQ